MKRMALFTCAVAVAGCGIVPRDGQFTCPDGVCPSGFTCAVDGLCRVGELDAAGLDAGEPRDAPGLDAPPDVPSVDAPGAREDCTPGPRRVPGDEDFDGRIDEGCATFLGPIHAVLPAMTVATPAVGYFGVELTDDARHLFTVASDGTAHPFSIASRPDPTQPFAPAIEARGSVLAGHAPSLLSVTGDGTEVYLQMADSAPVPAIHIYASTGTPSASWTTPVRVDALLAAGGEQVHPHVRRDGLELYFTVRPVGGGSGSLYVSRRASRGTPWGVPVLVGPGAFPILSPDGLSLYFMDGPATRVVRVATRTSRDGSFSGLDTAPPLPLIIEGAMLRPFFSTASREVFFSLQATATGLVPPDSPANASVFRAEVCRDGPCVREEVECDARSTRSLDGLHCYSLGLELDYATAAATDCAGQHLVSVHSAREASLVRSLRADAWLGQQGGAWASGEPFLYHEFAAPPTGGACAELGTGWPLTDCTVDHRVMCERDLWPTFTD